MSFKGTLQRTVVLVLGPVSSQTGQTTTSIPTILHTTKVNLSVRTGFITLLPTFLQVPFSKLSAGQTSRRSRSTQEQRSVQQIAWLALNIWDLPKQSAQWFEKAVSPVETASMSGVEKLFFSRFIPVVTG